MITPHNTAIVAAFFMDGLLQHDEHKLTETWGKGFYELVYEITRYAEYCWELAEAGGKLCDFPGVYDYEVSTDFGRWFGAHILNNNGDAPSPEMCKRWLLEEAEKFFTGQGRWPEPTLFETLSKVEFRV